MLSAQPSGYRYFIELSFNGTPFSGWQIQPGATTVQETLNYALGILLEQPVNLVGCGRTDAGVYASHFVAHFDISRPIEDCRQLTYRLNRYLKYPIDIGRIVPVGPDVHARFDATSRTYHYLISRTRSPFLEAFSWHLSIPLEVELMNQACVHLLGKQDFTSLSKLHTDVKTNICEVFDAGWVDQAGVLVFRIRADRFLRNMVRAAVGTLLEVGKGKMLPADVQTILLAEDRSEAGMSVPAKGLFLTRVEYPKDKFVVDPRTPFTDWIR